MNHPKGVCSVGYFFEGLLKSDLWMCESVIIPVVVAVQLNIW